MDSGAPCRATNRWRESELAMRIVARVTRTLVGDVSVGLPPTRMSARAGPYGSDAGEYSVLVFAVV